MCISTDQVGSNDVLNRPLDFTEVDETLWNDKCDYLDLDSCSNLNPNYNPIALQLNIRSLLAHQHELKQLIRTTEKKKLAYRHHFSM